MSRGADEGESSPREERGDDDQHAPFEGARERMEHTREQFDQARERARDQFDQANERIKERTGRDLLLAIAVALVLGVAVLSSLLFLKGLFVVVALAGAGIGVFELVRAFQGGGRRVDLIPQLVAVPLVLLPAYFLDEQVHWTSVFLAIALIIVWRLVVQMVEGDGRTRGATAVLDDVVASGFIALYVPFLASLALSLLKQESGEWWILAFLTVVVVADTGAYASGLAFGKHKMAPRISPNKTWEGFAGAAVAALLAGTLLAHFMLGLPWWCGLVFGAVILATATVGDLGESMLKRDLGIKDMSDWIPGHGGVLDRLDSILLSAGAALGLFLALSPLSSL